MVRVKTITIISEHSLVKTTPDCTYVICFKTSQYLAVKSEPFFLGREILDPADFSQFLHPFPADLRPISDSPLAYHPPTSPTPGYPANPRMQLCRLYLQLGAFLDYYTGQHEPSLSARLRNVIDTIQRSDVSVPRAIIPIQHLPLFPQFVATESFPPTFLIHGGADTAVKPQESLTMQKILQELKVEVQLRVVEGKEHSFDYEPVSEEGYVELFDEAFEFISKCMRKE